MFNADTYSEVYEILSYMNKTIVMKVPIEILEVIKENRNLNYISKIDKQDLFNLNNLSKDAINLLAWIDVNYWMDSNKKEKIKLSLENNFTQNNIKVNYNLINKKTNDEYYLIDYKESLFTKLKNKIKKFFNYK